MEWLLKFAEMNEDEKAKIIFHFIKIFIISTSSLIVYKYLFGDFVVLEFTFKNMIDFVNSKYLFLSLFSLFISWDIFWILKFAEKLIANSISNILREFIKINVTKITMGKLNFRITKRMIKLVNILIKYKLLKIKKNKIEFPNVFISAKNSLAEPQKVKNEAEKTYYILSVMIVIFGLETVHYTGFYGMLWISFALGFLSFLIATLYTFSLRNEKMILAICQSIKNFTEKYEYHRDNQSIS